MSDRPAVIETHSFDYIPPTERSGTISSQVRFWFMVNATLITAFTGAVGPLFGMSLSWTLVAIVTGTIAGTLFQAFHGAQGPHMGLPQMIQSRVQFGSRGAIVPILAATIVPIGFAIFFVQTGAAAFTDLVPATGFQLPQVVIGVLAIVLAIVGYRLIVRFEGILAYIMGANLVLLTVAAIAVLPLGELLSVGTVTVVAFLAQFGASASYQIAIAPIVSDYTRYLPERMPAAAVSASVFVGTTLSAVWIESLGAAVSLSYPDTDVISGIRLMGDEWGFGLGIATMAIAIVVCLVTASISFYSGSVSFLSALEAFRPLKPTARLRGWTISIAGALALVAGLAMPDDILTGFSTFLLLLGYLLIPWTAVNLTDYYLVRRGRYSISDILRSDGGIYGRWGGRGLIAYALGIVAMVPFFSTGFYTGPVAAALDGADISFVIGLIVSAVAYLLLMRSVDIDAELVAVRTAPINTLGFAETASPRSPIIGTESS
ncbi:cytosine permease [Agromyces tropicus]|uniref:Cytosine permease n=1 Tax=Agromyces tropicus TaxID=555371 RepID=A0ABP5FHD9_9MICO